MAGSDDRWRGSGKLNGAAAPQEGEGIKVGGMENNRVEKGG